MKKIYIILGAIVILLIGTFFVLSAVAYSVAHNCDEVCVQTARVLALENNLTATLNILLDPSIPIMNYGEEIYSHSANSHTLVQQVQFGIDGSGYVLEYGVNAAKADAVRYPDYLSLSVIYDVSDTPVRMTFLDYGPDGELDDVLVNEKYVFSENLPESQERYEAELAKTATYYSTLQTQ